MSSRRFGWLCILAAGIALETDALLEDHAGTLSATTRDLFHTDTKTGRSIFLAALAGSAAWFGNHIAGGTQ